MFLFQLDTKTPASNANAVVARFNNELRWFSGLTGLVSAGALEERMEALRSLVSGSKPLAGYIAGNKELAAKWSQMCQAYDIMKQERAQSPGTSFYNYNSYGYSELVEASAGTLNLAERRYNAPANTGFTQSPQAPMANSSPQKFDQYYAEVMGKLDAMTDFIENNRPDLAAQKGAEILNSDAYEELFRKSPAFRMQFENALYGLKVVTPGSKEGMEVLEKLQKEYVRVQTQEKIDSHLAAVPTSLNGAQRSIIMGDAYHSLKEIKFNLVEINYSNQAYAALEAGDLQKANGILDNLSLISDIRYGVLRFTPAQAEPGQKPKYADFGYPIVQDNTDLSARMPVAGAYGITYLPNTVERRFAEGSRLDRINRAVLAGNPELAKDLIAGRTNAELFDSRLALLSQKPITPDYEKYSERLMLAAAFGIPDTGYILNLIPGWTAGVEAVEAYKAGVNGDNSLMAYHIAAAAGYLTLDLFAIFSGGFSKGATAILREARAVERLAAMGGDARAIAKSLDELAVLLKEANAAGTLKAVELTRIEETVADIKRMAGALATDGTEIAGLGKQVAFKGGVKEVDLTLPRIGKLPRITNAPVKLQSKLEPALNKTVGAARKMPKIAGGGVAPKPLEPRIGTIESTARDYENLGKTFDNFSAEIDKSMNKLWTPSGLLNKMRGDVEAQVEAWKEIKPILGKSKAPKYLDELGKDVRASIGNLKDGEHFDLTLKGKSATGEFTIVKEGDDVSIYLKADYDKRLAWMEKPTVKAGEGTADAGKLWNSQLYSPTPMCTSAEVDGIYAKLMDSLDVNDAKAVASLADGEEYSVRIKKTVYTFVNEGGTVKVYDESVRKTIMNQAKKAYGKAGQLVEDAKGVPLQQKGKDFLTSIPKKTLEWTMYKPKGWTGLKPIGFESWGDIPGGINKGANWWRTKPAFSVPTIKSNFSLWGKNSLALGEIKGAGTLHGFSGTLTGGIVAYPVRWGVGTLSATGRAVSYPAQYVLNLTTGAIGTGLLAAEAGVGIGLKGLDMWATTLMHQNTAYIVGKTGLYALQQTLLMPEDLGLQPGKTAPGKSSKQAPPAARKEVPSARSGAITATSTTYNVSAQRATELVDGYISAFSGDKEAELNRITNGYSSAYENYVNRELKPAPATQKTGSTSTPEVKKQPGLTPTKR
ncbi:MAG: hypothetical protein WC717_05710 [Candidatus Micrarchaeia archaeon]|jgi:hypothetical protein